MIISIEVPVFKGEFLRQCIDSVFNQSSDAWHLSLVWDGGDELSRTILAEIEGSKNPKVSVYFNENRGIAKSRAFLSNQNDYPYILPLDDDDELAPNAVESYLKAAVENPWASLIRGRRSFINQKSEAVEERQWFPFGQRNYFRGMVTDVYNQAQPYLIRKSAYDQTMGWRGFDDFMQAGEDCDIFLQLEEVAHFELINEVLYYYRLHNERASDALTNAAAFEMWRRLADDAVQRMELPLLRTSDAPPFTFEQKKRNDFDLDNLEVIVCEGRTSEAFKRIGIPEDQIIETKKTDIESWRMKGFERSSKKLICFVDDSVEINHIDCISNLLQALNESRADLIATSNDLNGNPSENFTFEGCSWLNSGCLLVRREVMRATGGFDFEHIPESMRLIDFSIQARRRDFSCFIANIDGINSMVEQTSWMESDFDALKTKWYSHVAYVPSTNDLNRLFGDGARR